MSSTLSLLINLTALGIFGYSAYFMKFSPSMKGLHALMPEQLRAYGQLKFLTFQCLLIQLLNAALHVGAEFIRVLEKPRDLVFTALAFPIGSIVVYSFWAVWFIVGRKYIFPEEASKFYPDWLNHSTHTIIAPINLIMAILVNHKYNQKLGVSLLVAFLGTYCILLHVIKYQSGHWVYGYLELMTDVQRYIYMACSTVFGFLMYKLGQLMTDLAHTQCYQRPALKKNKQK